MDSNWRVPMFLNTILINQKKDDKFSFLHGDATVEAMWKSEDGDCDTDGRQATDMDRIWTLFRRTV